MNAFFVVCAAAICISLLLVYSGWVVFKKNKELTILERKISTLEANNRNHQMADQALRDAQNIVAQNLDKAKFRTTKEDDESNENLETLESIIEDILNEKKAEDMKTLELIKSCVLEKYRDAQDISKRKKLLDAMRHLDSMME